MNLSICPLARNVAIALMACLFGTIAPAQEIPRQITLVVGVAAGSVTDSIARIVAQRMAVRLKIPIIVDNKAGAAQLIGINAVKGKPADGRVLLLIAGSAIGQAPAFRKDITYSPLKDFSFVAMTAVSAGVVAVNPKHGFNSVRDLVAYAKSNPGKLNFGSAGAGNAGHLQMEYFMRKTGISMVHIPFKSDNEQAIELSGGNLDVSIITAAAAVPLARTNRIKLLAVTSVNPVSYLPDVPNLRQVGVDGIEGLDPFTFFGIVGPAGMSTELIRTLNEAHNAAMREPEVINILSNTLSSDPVTESPEAFRKFVEQELTKWGEIGKNLKLD
jgi:tripartite-type tricarboxylate transporter receptor subunit TctC